MAKTKKVIDTPTAKQIAEWKGKAEKWDKLNDKIYSFYFDKDGDELPEGKGGDLCDIGEVAATAFGYF